MKEFHVSLVYFSQILACLKKNKNILLLMFSHQPLKTAVLSSGSDVWFKLTNVFHFTAYFILDENLPLLAALQTKRRTHSEIRTITNDNNGTVEA